MTQKRQQHSFELKERQQGLNALRQTTIEWFVNLTEVEPIFSNNLVQIIILFSKVHTMYKYIYIYLFKKSLCVYKSLHISKKKLRFIS